jgi:hypothetical protein
MVGEAEPAAQTEATKASDGHSDDDGGSDRNFGSDSNVGNDCYGSKRGAAIIVTDAQGLQSSVSGSRAS